MFRTSSSSWASGQYPRRSGRGQAFVLAAALVIAAAPQTASAQDKPRDDDDASPGQFAYVANFGSQNTISGFTINETSGALTPVPGSPFNSVNAPISVAVDPTGSFVYATRGAAISGYTINAATGALTPVRGSPFSSPDPRGIAVDPTGRFVYVANFQSGNVTAYRINASTGALIRIPGSPFAADSGSYSVAVDPTGRFLYASNVVSGDITEYAINATTGALTPIAGSPVANAQNGFSLTVEPLGQFAYETNQNGTVLAYQINGTTGALTPVFGSPFAAGTGPFSVAADPTGRFVYVVNAGTATPGTATVSAYTINRQPNLSGGPGSLTPVPGSPFAAGFQADFVTVDPTGRFVYVANYADGNVGVYSIAFTGALTPIAGSPFPAGSGPNWIAISAGRRRTHPVYSATEIPPPQFAPVQSIIPAAINNNGEVTGSVVFQAGERFASGFLYSGGTSIVVGSLRFSNAFGINDNTQVVGVNLSPPFQGAPPPQAFLFSNGTTTDLDNVKGRQSAAFGINNAGEITGSLSTGTCTFPPFGCNLGDTHAFLDTGGGLTDLGTLGGNFSTGLGINNRGEIVGASNLTTNGLNHLFLYSHGTMHDRGTLNGNNTEGSAINDDGQIIGSASQIGFLFSRGVFHRLPTLNGGTYSLPGGINNRGAVVGTSDVSGGGPTHAFLYTDGELIDLNNIVEPSLPLLTSAAGINDEGQIVASGLNGQSYVLTPQRRGDD